MFPKLPEELVANLFNLHRGEEAKRYCATCNSATDQIALSYSEVAALRASLVTRVLGRIVDIVPGSPFLVGKPALCGCGMVNF